MWMPISTRGRSGSPNKKTKRHQSGLTLIELLVGITIIGMIFAVGASGLKSAFDTNLRQSSSRLASTLRYLSNKAVTDHLYLRMVYNLSDQTYRVEESRDPTVISPEEEEKETVAKAKEAKEKETEKEDTEKEDAEEAPSKPEAAFSPSESKLLKPVKLPSGVFFKDVSVSYLPHRKEQGEVATYFFPDGYATPTLINLRNEEDDNHFSVELFALSGRVKVIANYKESLEEEKR